MARRRPLPLLLLPLLLAATLAPAQEEGTMQKLPGDNAEIYALNQEDLWQLLSLVRLGLRETDALFRRETAPKRPLQFLGLRRDFQEKEFRGGDIPVPLGESPARQLIRIFRATLWRRMRENIPAGAEATPPPFLNLLAAGMAGRTLYGGIARRGFYQRDFRIPRYQFRQRRFPSLRQLLEMPVPSDRPAQLHLYLVHANLFLDILQESVPDMGAFLETWRSHAQTGRLDALQALADALPITGNPQEWYEQRALTTAKDQQLRQNGLDSLREELEDILTVSLLSANPSDGLLRVHLEQIPQRLQDYRLDDQALATLQTRLLRLQRNAPLLLQNAIGKYLAAVDAFRNRDFRTFREELRQARTQWDLDAKRQRRAEELLLDDDGTPLKNDALWQDWLDAWERIQPFWETIPPWKF
ncbi:MAG: hypothetical protein ACI4SG_06020 [Oligosphaeraceae bacterium]